MHNGHSVEPDIYVPGSRGIRRIALDPHQEKQDVDGRFIKYIHPQFSGGKMSGSDFTDVSLFDLIERDFSVALKIPNSVVRVASMPIMRRADLPGEYAVNGNMEDVILAQDMVLQELEHNLKALTKHVAVLEAVYGAAWIENETVYQCLFDFLRHQRLVATPLPRYWERAELFYDEMYGCEDVPPLSCPNCAGAI